MALALLQRAAVQARATVRGFAASRTPWYAASSGLRQKDHPVVIEDFWGTKDPEVHKVTLIPGDGVGPEITKSVRDVFEAAQVPVEWDVHEITHDELSEETSIAAARRLVMPAVESIRKTKMALKGPTRTPTVVGHPSLNMLLRTELDLFANVVPCHTLPNVLGPHTDVDMVVIRENTEGEYKQLEHELVPGLVESLKVVSARGSRRVAEYAFEYAKRNGRKKVTAVHKANIMKLCDGLFLRETREAAKLYPEIKYEEMIIDNTCMQLAWRPQQFDVMVMPNLYGNIVSNIGAGLMGGPGLTPGANMGMDIALFEPGSRHVGSDIAGKDRANPTAMLLSAVWMLRLLRLTSHSTRIERAVNSVISDPSLRTADIGGTSTTSAFTQAVIDRLHL